MLLRELEGFEACWLELRHTYPTSGEDNRCIAQAMGQLVDGTDQPAQVEAALPDHLQILFRRLAIAYFHGYVPPSVPMATQGATTPAVVQAKPPTPPGIAEAVAQVRALAQAAQRCLGAATSPTGLGEIADLDTLVLDWPDP